jgi:hypothetical protein
VACPFEGLVVHLGPAVGFDSSDLSEFLCQMTKGMEVVRDNHCLHAISKKELGPSGYLPLTLAGCQYIVCEVNLSA